MSENGIERPYGNSLPEGIKHLHGAMYLVRFDLLQVPDPEAINTEEKKYEFRNPRTLTEKGQQVLFDKRKSQEIRDSIKEKTLMNPFVCRWKFEGEEKRLIVQMVGGERRHRAISWLCAHQEMVKDPSSARLNDDLEYEYDYKPADEVYEFVLCQIYAVSSDIDALALSYTENDCRVNQGEGADVAMVIELRRCNATDEKIMAAMSKDERWLRDTDSIIAGLGETALADLMEDRIDRDAALELLSIKEKHGDGVAEEARIIANESSQRDYQKKFERCTKNIEKAMTEKELAEGGVEEAKFQGKGVTEAEAAVVESDAKVTRTIKERDQQKPKTSGAQVRAAGKSATARGGRGGSGGGGGKSTTANPPSKMLRGPKIKEYYIEPIEDLIKRGGKSIELDDAVANVDALTLALKLIRAITEGDGESMEIIRLHYKKRKKAKEEGQKPEEKPPEEKHSEVQTEVKEQLQDVLEEKQEDKQEEMPVEDKQE